MALMFVVEASFAQVFFFGNKTPRESATGMAGLTAVNFEFNGEDSDVPTLNFDNSLFSLTYSQANLFAALSFGSQNAPDTTTNDLSYLDFTGAIWGEVLVARVHCPEATRRILSPGAAGARRAARGLRPQ